MQDAATDNSIARRRRARLLWIASACVGVVVFGCTWALQNLLMRGRLYAFLAVQGSVQDRGMTRYAFLSSATGRHGPVAVVESNEDTQ